MKRVLISIVLVATFASVPVFAESRNAAERAFGAIAKTVTCPRPSRHSFAGDIAGDI